jgi:hypothetical protein
MLGDTRPSHNKLAHPRNNRILTPETLYVYEMGGCMSSANCSGNLTLGLYYSCALLVQSSVSASRGPASTALFLVARRSSFVKRISYLANKDGTYTLFLLRSPRIVGEAGFTLHETRAAQARHGSPHGR